jgi:catecholate siderophore receptor
MTIERKILARESRSQIHCGSRRIDSSTAILATVAITALCSTAMAQQAPQPAQTVSPPTNTAPATAASPVAAPAATEAPAATTAAPDAASKATSENTSTLPTVTIETTEEKPQPKPAPTKTAKPVVKVEADQPAPAKPKKAAKPAKPATPPPAAVDTPDDAVESVSADALDGVTPAQSARGGPTKIDGYIAKQTTTATKSATAIKDIPQAVSVTTKEQASDQGSRSVGQALTYVPGVNVAQGEGHRDQLTIRGQATTADFYVDGVRDDVEYYRDLYNVESVEVVKGPNAMIFGRGGSGGVVNRSTKQADGQTVRDATVTFGSYDTKRTTVDVGQALSSSAAFRLNAMYEDSNGFRDYFELERFGLNPTFGFNLSDQTKLLVSYEYYKDERTVDRGIPARDGRPLQGFRDTFFGNPFNSVSDYEGHRVSAILDHRFNEAFKVRSATVFSDGDKVYQNTFANSVVNGAGNVTLSGYLDTMDRQTFNNQTDWTYRHEIAPGMRSTVVFGTELAHQDSQNFRDNARFDNVAGPGSKVVSIANPTISSPVFFNNPNRRRDATLESVGVYVQNQLEVSRYLELIGGIRFDHYDVEFNDALVAGSAYTRQDDVWSPRAGVVFKPSDGLSVYLSYSKAFVPSVADQLNFISIGAGANLKTGADLDPEEFVNKEIGFKWEVTPRLMMTGALFQLDRTNTATVTGAGGVEQFGSTRTEGAELGLTGYLTDQWQVSAGFGHQIALVTAGSAATIGKDVASVPRNTLSLWNKYQFSPMLGAGLGLVHKTSFFANADNAVEVPGYTRLDAALFFKLSDTWSAQLNVENILNEDYFTAAHNNFNIMPGAPTSAYVTIGAKF